MTTDGRSPGGPDAQGRNGELDELDDIDQLILDLLRETESRLDPVPAHLVDDVKFALTVRALDDDIAELTSMSLTATRSEQAEPAMADTVTFSAGSLSLMITVTPNDDDTVRIDAWVTSPSARVELSVNGIVHTTLADEVGRLSFDDIAHGRASFIVFPDADTPTVVTPSITI